MLFIDGSVAFKQKDWNSFYVHTKGYRVVHSPTTAATSPDYVESVIATGDWPQY